MMSRGVLVALLVAGLIIAPNLLSGTAWGQENVTVRGRLVNGTQGADVPSRTTVFLHAFFRDTTEVTTLETISDELGEFRFEDVVPNGDIGYAVSADYAGMPYTVLIGPEDLNDVVEVVVYEATQDLSVVRVEHQALVITGLVEEPQGVEAVEFVSLTNDSDRTLVPDLSNVGQGQFSFMRFSLPAGATNFDIQSDLVGGEVIPVGTGFGLTSPVSPGEHSLNFSFTVPYQGDSISYRQSLLQGADIYQVLIPQRLEQIQVSGLDAAPNLEVEGSFYRVWEGRNFAPGQGVMLQLRGLPQPSLLARGVRVVSGVDFWLLAIPAMLGTTLALLLVYAGVKSPRLAEVNGGEVLAQTPVDGRPRQALIREIALLDQRFESGQVPEDQYRSRRSALKDRILLGAAASSSISKEGS